MKHFFLMLSVASAIAINAQSTFYVDQNNPSASDDNPGTADAPWISFNTAKWTDGCTVMLKGDYYVDATESYNVAVNATLIGTDNATIYGYETGEEEPTSYDIFFNCEENKFTVKDLSIANYYNTTGDFWGGVFKCGTESELILENVNISNVFMGKAGRRGAAIYTKGKLTATNVNFENCTASRGAAVAISGNNPASFTSCSFIGNNNSIGEVCSPRGGAIDITGNSDGSNVTIDKCYFENNVCDVKTDTRNYAAGGAISVHGLSPKFHVSNSTFYNNAAGWGGGAIYYEKNAKETNVMDIRFTNNTFIDNTILMQATNHGTMIFVNGAAGEGLTGTFAMVNNTSFNNNTTNPNSVVYMTATPLDLILVNNLAMDRAIIEKDGTQSELGWGYTFQENAPYLFKSVDIRNNILEAGVGGGHISFSTEDLLADDLVNLFTTVANRPQIELASDLSKENGLGYLALGENSIAIDGGTNSCMFAGANLVPTTDILGNPIVNGTRDIGAWEYGNSAGIDNIAANTTTLTYNSASETVTVSETARFINVYDITGTLVANAKNAASISLSNLANGMFIIVAVVENAPVTAKILR